MDNNTSYQIYIDNILQLAESVVIKSHHTAEMQNKQLLNEFGPGAVNGLDPTTWRYYLQISGQYHPRDQVMTVISLDTLETINFTKTNLLLHTATRKAYEYGQRNYKELLVRYPGQERLIMGILYPVDIHEAIAAPEGKILTYPPELVEEHEYTLMSRLQQWVYSFLARWDNVQFRLSDSLYAATVWGIMTIQMVNAITLLRLRLCKTNEAHTFHIQQYLASFGMIDSYMRFMTREQILFFYRNIKYISRNSGKAAVFKWLMHHIMTRRELPLAEYQMRHDLSAQPQELYPLLNFKKRPLNTLSNADKKDVFSVDEVLDKEAPLARDNRKYRREYELQIIQQMRNSLSNKQKTKLLESSTIDYSGSERYTLAYILLNEWLDLSQRGAYSTYIAITTPSSGEILSIQANRAYELYIYAFCKSMGLILETLPRVVAERVMIMPKASVADLMQVSDPRLVNEEFAQQLVNLLPAPVSTVSTVGFYNWCESLQKAAMAQYYLISQEARSFARGIKHAMMSRCFSDSVIQLGQANQTYSDWFAEQNLDISSYSQDDLQSLCTEILTKATGLDVSNRITAAQVQAAMIRLMAQLGSYSVQYTRTINEEPTRDAANHTCRVDDLAVQTLSDVKVIPVIEVIDRQVHTQIVQTLDLSSRAVELDLRITRSAFAHHEIRPQAGLSSEAALQYHAKQATQLDVTHDYVSTAANPHQVVEIVGIDTYLNLTAEEQATITDLWH